MNYNFDSISVKEKTNDNSLDNMYKFSLGSHSYYIDNITKLLEEKKIFNKKKKVYHILNPYNYIINDYENKDVIDIKTKFNEKYNKIFNKQEYFKIFEIIKEFDIKNKTVMCFDNYTKEICDTLNIKCDKYDIDNLKKITKKYDVIFANITLKLTTYQEQTFYPTFLNIASCLKYLNKNGMFITKLYNIITSQTLSLINSLFYLFNKKSFYVPFTSEPYKNEKYLICSDLNKNITDINNIQYKISNKFKNTITKMNIELIVKQTNYINLVADYIQKKNYYSTDYEKYFNIQLEKTNFWINKYLN